jgi:hypothetical protein
MRGNLVVCYQSGDSVDSLGLLALQAEQEEQSREQLRGQIKDALKREGLVFCAELQAKNGLPSLLRQLDISPKVPTARHKHTSN